MTTLQKTIVTTTVAVLAGAGIYEARQASQLRNQVQMLQEQQAPLTEQIAQLQHELDDATNRLAGSTEELANAKRNNLDLLKLRGEVGLLRRQTNQLGGLLKEAARKPPEPATEASENELVTRAQYKFAGFAEPKSTVNSTYWAINQGDIQTVLASMSPALQSKTREEWKDIPDDKLKAGLLNDSDNRNVTGYRITNKLVVSGDEVVLTIFQEGRNREKKMRFVRVGAEWKYDGPPKM
jgi:hypothetical protein